MRTADPWGSMFLLIGIILPNSKNSLQRAGATSRTLLSLCFGLMELLPRMRCLHSQPSSVGMAATTPSLPSLPHPLTAALLLLSAGLDAFQAQNVMETLWSLARGGRSVISTIHQPRSSIYKMFDLLLLLSEGRTIYAGPAAEVGFF